MDKEVKCRKDHICACCETTIKKGEQANFFSMKGPRFSQDDHETQIGIEYYHCWLHVDSNICDEFIYKAENEK